MDYMKQAFIKDVKKFVNIIIWFVWYICISEIQPCFEHMLSLIFVITCNLMMDWLFINWSSGLIHEFMIYK